MRFTVGFSSLLFLLLTYRTLPARAADCRDLLVGNEYSCRVAVENGAQFSMNLHFQPSTSSRKLALRRRW